MAAIFSFKCSTCGEVHEGAPSFGFRAPDPYLEQPKDIQGAGKLGTDLCRYTDKDGEHFFIRVCLEVPIHGTTELFTWGVWVSLSETSFARYVETYDTPDTSDRFFGWLSNHLPYYEKTYALKTMVHPRADGIRPFIVLEKSGHPLSTDFHSGISIQRAQEIAEQVLHR